MQEKIINNQKKSIQITEEGKQSITQDNSVITKKVIKKHKTYSTDECDNIQESSPKLNCIINNLEITIENSYNGYIKMLV